MISEPELGQSLLRRTLQNSLCSSPFVRRTQRCEPLSSSSNVISDETGELDVRFALRREFCGERGLPVETLPSELSAEDKGVWEKLKDTELSTSNQE